MAVLRRGTDGAARRVRVLERELSQAVVFNGDQGCSSGWGPGSSCMGCQARDFTPSPVFHLGSSRALFCRQVGLGLFNTPETITDMASSNLKSDPGPDVFPHPALNC
jgi:hypothetical protein